MLAKLWLVPNIGVAAKVGRVAATYQKFTNSENVMQGALSGFQHHVGKIILFQQVEGRERHGRERSGWERKVGHKKRKVVEDVMLSLVDFKQDTGVEIRPPVQLLRFIIQIYKLVSS